MLRDASYPYRGLPVQRLPVQRLNLCTGRRLNPCTGRIFSREKFDSEKFDIFYLVGNS